MSEEWKASPAPPLGHYVSPGCRERAKTLLTDFYDDVEAKLAQALAAQRDATLRAVLALVQRCSEACLNRDWRADGEISLLGDLIEDPADGAWVRR